LFSRVDQDAGLAAFNDQSRKQAFDAVIFLVCFNPAWLTFSVSQKAKAAVEQLFAYCGRPLDSEFKHQEQGFKQYASGPRKETRKFYYAATTSQYAKGVCLFSVEVVPADRTGYAVTTFGPLKLQSGHLPDWLK
jgi:hypothetical protein